MFEKVLIANRGEIALRVIRACRERVRTVAVYLKPTAQRSMYGSPTKRHWPATRQRQLSPHPAVLSAAEITGADAVHPGYGFLAENIGFARALKSHGSPLSRPRTSRDVRRQARQRLRPRCRGHSFPGLGAVSDADEGRSSGASRLPGAAEGGVWWRRQGDAGCANESEPVALWHHLHQLKRRLETVLFSSSVSERRDT